MSDNPAVKDTFGREAVEQLASCLSEVMDGFAAGSFVEAAMKGTGGRPSSSLTAVAPSLDRCV